MSHSQRSNTWFWLLFGLAAVGMYFVAGRGDSGTFRSYQRGSLPAIDSQGTWLNSAPLSWDQLGGKVVWLEFSFIH